MGKNTKDAMRRLNDERRTKRIGNIYGEQFGAGFAGNVWEKSGISPALMTAQGGGRTPMVIVEVTR